MKIFWLCCLSLALFASDSFITKREYGQMLYQNPRGIGCIYCHGRHGKGKLIAKYKEDGKKILLNGPDIQKVSKSKLKKSLLARHKVMPTYFLTDKEIGALYYFLHTKRRKNGF